MHIFESPLPLARDDFVESGDGTMTLSRSGPMISLLHDQHAQYSPVVEEKLIDGNTPDIDSIIDGVSGGFSLDGPIESYFEGYDVPIKLLPSESMTITNVGEGEASDEAITSNVERFLSHLKRGWIPDFDEMEEIQ